MKIEQFIGNCNQLIYLPNEYNHVSMKRLAVTIVNKQHCINLKSKLIKLLYWYFLILYWMHVPF